MKGMAGRIPAEAMNTAVTNHAATSAANRRYPVVNMRDF
jgi:hypothetical protein